MPAAAALDTTIAVVTPENIAFEYQLAGPFRRLPAYLIDVIARWIIMAAVILGMWIVGGMIRMSALQAYMLAATFLLYFVFTNFYGTLMESYFNGKTIGKWACGIRVVGTDGGPIDFRQALLRNLIRIADLAPYVVLNDVNEEIPPIFFLPVGVVGLVTMLCTRRMQRLGDLACGTMVIVDERNWELPVSKIEDPRVAALASYLPADYRFSRSMSRTLAVYVERRQYLTPARRREIARKLTTPLMDQFDFRPDIDPDLLMLALYHRNFLWNEGDDSADLSALNGFSPLAKDQSAEEPPVAATVSDSVTPVSAPSPTVATQDAASEPAG
ncbi:RDD family protein [Crateriforma conspicua]|uniref:RDD family protein n=1 Tax=Crateriforma conspicua TaxID=2527996 RepID=A0A5C5Y1T3_9PLAN|nr:RDD family protein [Crateriforma conspicua]QDV63813.1 RDD family protein [Crateriforma conspicua]TWT69174.1 RDD family protein [Crateriforma conspicua]